MRKKYPLDSEGDTRLTPKCPPAGIFFAIFHKNAHKYIQYSLRFLYY